MIFLFSSDKQEQQSRQHSKATKYQDKTPRQQNNKTFQDSLSKTLEGKARKSSTLQQTTSTTYHTTKYNNCCIYIYHTSQEFTEQQRQSILHVSSTKQETHLPRLWGTAKPGTQANREKQMRPTAHPSTEETSFECPSGGFQRRSIMTQAVGKASRFGQKREVRVWQYAADGVEVYFAAPSVNL